MTGDSDSYIFEEYRSDEMKLDESTENVMLEEDMLQGESQSENSGKDITQGESQSEDDIVPGEGKNENVRQEDTVQGENQQEKDSQQSASDEAEFPNIYGGNCTEKYMVSMQPGSQEAFCFIRFHTIKNQKVLCAQKNIINLDSRHLWDVCGLRWKMQNGSQITVHREQPWKFMRMMIRDHWENLRQRILIQTVRIKAGIRQIRM